MQAGTAWSSELRRQASGLSKIGVGIGRRPKDHRDIRILMLLLHHTSPNMGDSRKHGWSELCLYLIFWGPNSVRYSRPPKS